MGLEPDKNISQIVTFSLTQLQVEKYRLWIIHVSPLILLSISYKNRVPGLKREFNMLLSSSVSETCVSNYKIPKLRLVRETVWKQDWSIIDSILDVHRMLCGVSPGV